MSDTQSVETITVYSDYVCPFCYLGRQSLARYRADRETELRIDWHPFDLRAGKRGPDGRVDHDADDGKDEDYYERARQNVRRLQAEYGVEMADDLRTDVDSLDAQVAAVAVREAYDYETWLAFDEGIFEALWQNGRDMGDADVLVDVAETASVDPGLVREAIADEGRRGAIRERFEAARQRGVTGVPTFVYGEHAARGAVPPEHLERLVEG